MDKTFNIKVTIDSRWVDHFCSFLKYMESMGNNDHTGIVCFYAEGSGDFKPRFEVETQFKEKQVYKRDEFEWRHLYAPEIMFDANPVINITSK